MSDDKRTQTVAVSLILIALFSIGLGERLHYAQLVGFALTVGGGGLGILTNKYAAQQKIDSSGGTVTVNPAAPEAK